VEGSVWTDGHSCRDGDAGRHVGCAGIEFLWKILAIVARIAIENLVGG
jgi:hypothetical protein